MPKRPTLLTIKAWHPRSQLDSWSLSACCWYLAPASHTRRFTDCLENDSDFLIATGFGYEANRPLIDGISIRSPLTQWLDAVQQRLRRRTRRFGDSSQRIGAAPQQPRSRSWGRCSRLRWDQTNSISSARPVLSRQRRFEVCGAFAVTVTAGGCRFLLRRFGSNGMRRIKVPDATRDLVKFEGGVDALPEILMADGMGLPQLLPCPIVGLPLS